MKSKTASIIFYIFLFFIGILILFVNNKIKHTIIPQPGEYYYSNFLRSNYSYIFGSLLFGAGIISGYYFNSNPWVTGISLIAVFPITAIYEATIYRGSHNLIPVELAVHILFALPAIIGAYIGRYVKK